MLNMVEIACMETLNVRSFINRSMRTPCWAVTVYRRSFGTNGPDHGSVPMKFPFQMKWELTEGRVGVGCRSTGWHPAGRGEGSSRDTPKEDNCLALPIGLCWEAQATSLQSSATYSSERKMIMSRKLECLQWLKEDAVIHTNVLIARVDVWDMLRLEVMCLCLIKQIFFPFLDSNSSD